MRHVRIKNQHGFTLLEVMITMGILLTLVIAVATMLRSSIDVKQALAREARVTHRLSLAVHSLTWDIEHAFITGLNDEQRGGANRRFKTIFKVEKGGETDKLFLSTMGHRPMKAGSFESSTSYVVYEVRDAKDSPGRRHLYRGVSPLVLDDLKQDPKMQVVVRNIKSFKVIPWRGDEWSNDRWDSSRGEWRDKLPHMVRIEVETWSEGDDDVTEETAQTATTGTVAVKTVVHIPHARFMKELKQPPTSPRWY